MIEAFWYGCPTCFALEPFLERWIPQLPDDVAFVHVHASGSQNWRGAARAYYVAEYLGVVDRLHRPLYDAVHVDRASLTDIGVLAALFERHAGTSRGAFQDAYTAFAVDRRLRAGDARLRKFMVRGVPTLIVAGKYRTTPRLAGGYPQTIELLEHLIELERNP